MFSELNTLNGQLTIGGFLVIVSVVLHIVLLAGFTVFIKRLSGKFVHTGDFAVPALITVLFGLGVTLIHIIEIWAWAGVFLYLGAIEGLEEALYFSTVTATTVGYGDLVLDPSWRLLGSFEAMFGIVAFGISTAFLIAVLRASFSRYLSP